jgi:putative transposase
MFGKIRKHLGEIFHELARRKESHIEEGHIAIDHVHICISIPPKYAVTQVVGFIKGKSAIYSKKLWRKAKKFSRRKLLGAWILRINSRKR